MAAETSENELRIDGKATLTMDRSKATMKPAATVTANTGQGISGVERFFMRRSIAD